jgi:ankyrin repeat protein
MFLFQAVECGHKEIIQLMLERGVDINTIDYKGNSGLHTAAKHGFYEIASMLLKQGANFESSNNVCKQGTLCSVSCTGCSKGQGEEVGLY